MSWLNQLNRDSLSWLQEPTTPEVRYLAMRDVLDYPPNDPELRSAREVAHTQGPIAMILDKMDPAGYWVRPGPGYNPKYRSTVWSTILLAQLGASVAEDERIATACAYLLDHALLEGGQFTYSEFGTIDCLQGNLAWALLELGCDDPRLERAFDWMARSVTGEGVAPLEEPGAPVHYFHGKCAPGFACRYNAKLPCAWGGVKVLMAFGKWPEVQRTPVIQRAIQQGVEFMLSVDPAQAAYPTRHGQKPSPIWWKFGFPVFYITDLLQLVEALVALGYGADPRLVHALEVIRAKQDADGCWALEYDYTGKTWLSFGELKQPNKWVTLRALRVLKAVC